MRVQQEDTPPSSVNGDEITGVDDEIIYLEEMEELQFDEDEEDKDEDMEEGNEHEMAEEREPPEDHATLVFSKHTGSVFCCDLHPSGKLAVTGGEDDKAYVWSVENGQIVMECTAHKDSVIFVGFSPDGTYLSSADMGGLIKVWKCNLEDSQPWPIVFEYEADDLVLGQWHFGTKVLIVGSVSGDIYVFKIPSGINTKVLQGSNVRVECVKLFKDGVRLAAGYEDGTVKVWDLKTSSVLHQIPANIHQIPVTAIDTHPENNLMASIDTNGKVVLTTSTNGKIVGQLETENDLETVAFSQDPQLGYLALGTLKGSVSIWDVARQMIRHQCEKSDNKDTAGVTKLIWVKNHLITSCLDGSIRIYGGRSGERKALLTGHMDEVLDFCYNEKENIILTSSEDGTARIFKYEMNKDND